MRLPEELRQGIEREAAAVDPRLLPRAAREISERYRKGELSAAALRSPAHLAAYLQTRLPATFAANRRVFAEVAERLPGFAPHSLLDLGAGPGTSMWAAAEVFPGLEKITLVEREPQLVAAGRRVAAESRHPATRSAEWLRQDALASAASGPHDLVVASYTLAEISEKTAAQFMRTAWESSEELLVVIEPGTPAGFARVLAARTALLDWGAHLAAPCPHAQACPMAHAGDWCHFAVRLERSAAHRRLKQGALGYEDEKFSYLVASRAPAPLPAARVVRHPLARPGHIQFTLCAASGLQRRTVTKSQKEVYRRARKAEWGSPWSD
ncbi:MAG TPA: small ribosomal subunit Rsm22 family protein [Terriglobales bacterium]|jgi:ribosomal protein RSM22 (predicted rRNA methylase)|nr:small ribosomal subunit Rsm22 family protein [Terriglobales bacterium]